LLPKADGEINLVSGAEVPVVEKDAGLGLPVTGGI